MWKILTENSQYVPQSRSFKYSDHVPRDPGIRNSTFSQAWEKVSLSLSCPGQTLFLKHFLNSVCTLHSFGFTLKLCPDNFSFNKFNVFFEAQLKNCRCNHFFIFMIFEKGIFEELIFDVSIPEV